MNRVQRTLSGDRGVSLVETMISLLLLAGVLAATFTATTTGRRLFTLADDDAAGVIDVRTAVERLGRDVRNARAVDPGATRGQLALWVDANSDYQRQSSEVVAWSIVANGDHFDVRRQVGADAAVTQASTVVSAIAFCYRVQTTGACLNPDATPLDAAQAASVRYVETTMIYDPRISKGARERQVVFGERLRNVG